MTQFEKRICSIQHLGPWFSVLSISICLAISIGCVSERKAIEAFQLLPEIRDLAEKGDADAQFPLGERYSSGKGVGQDDTDADSLLGKASEQENPSRHDSRRRYYPRWGGELIEDQFAAELCTRPEAESGNQEAQNRLALLYECGQPEFQNLEEARRWYSKAVAQGIGISMQDLELLYRENEHEGWTEMRKGCFERSKPESDGETATAHELPSKNSMDGNFKAPKRIYAARPVYPYQFKRESIEGWVRLVIIIDEKSIVIDARAPKATHRDFTKPAIRAVLEWKFEPGIKDGKPVKVRRVQPISFKLN